MPFIDAAITFTLIAMSFSHAPLRHELPADAMMMFMMITLIYFRRAAIYRFSPPPRRHYC